MSDVDVQAKTCLQESLARRGCAEGQCGDCGAFTSDGSPPVLHEDSCPIYDDERAYRESVAARVADIWRAK